MAGYKSLQYTCALFQGLDTLSKHEASLKSDMEYIAAGITGLADKEAKGFFRPNGAGQVWDGGREAKGEEKWVTICARGMLEQGLIGRWICQGSRQKTYESDSTIFSDRES